MRIKRCISKAAELVDMTSGANVVEVGTWEPMQGLVLGKVKYPKYYKNSDESFTFSVFETIGPSGQ